MENSETKTAPRRLGNSLWWVMIKGRWLYLMCWLCWPIIQINPNVYFHLEKKMNENKRNGDRIYNQIKRGGNFNGD
jgi:hypothetical protein